MIMNSFVLCVYKSMKRSHNLSRVKLTFVLFVIVIYGLDAAQNMELLLAFTCYIVAPPAGLRVD